MHCCAFRNAYRVVSWLMPLELVLLLGGRELPFVALLFSHCKWSVMLSKCSSFRAVANLCDLFRSSSHWIIGPQCCRSAQASRIGKLRKSASARWRITQCLAQLSNYGVITMSWDIAHEQRDKWTLSTTHASMWCFGHPFVLVLHPNLYQILRTGGASTN